MEQSRKIAIANVTLLNINYLAVIKKCIVITKMSKIYIYIDRLHINEIKFVRSEADAEIIMAGLILTLMKFTNVSYDGV